MSREALSSLPDVSFIDEATTDEILDRLMGYYQTKHAELTGTTQPLPDAHPMRLVLYANAMLFEQAYQYIDRAGKLNLLKYTYGGWLDNVAAIRGITRREASAAEVTVRFSTGSAAVSAIAIPQGTRVTNGDRYFYVKEYSEIAVGDTYTDVECECTETGIIGNGLLAGEINTLVDTLPYITAVSNINTSEGGADIEDDDTMAERVYLAPNAYSVAGPEGAYEYWAKNYSQNIGDVKVTTPTAGTVLLRVLMADGTLPSQTFIDGLEEYLASKGIRPLTDNVSVAAPTIATATVDITYYINRSDQAKASIIQNDVQTAVNEYVAWQTAKIGRDLNPSDLVMRVMAAGAKRVIIHNPSYQQISNAYVVQITSVQVTYGGLEDN